MRTLIFIVLILLEFNLYGQDYSQKYYLSLVNNFADSTEYSDELIKHDFSSYWAKEINQGLLGYIGKNYQRIELHLNKIIRSETDKREYLIFGKTMVKNNICDFLGTITILHIRKIDHDLESDPFFRGSLIAKYELFEDPNQNHTGYFKGTFQSYFAIEDNSEIIPDDFWNEVDSFSNFHFVGVWIEHNSSKMKTCNFGQYKIPYAGDLDIGDIDFHPNPKYLDKGWNSYNHNNIEWWK